MKAWIIATEIRMRWLRPSYRKKVKESGAIGYYIFDKYIYLLFKDPISRAKGLDILDGIAKFTLLKEPVDVDEEYLGLGEGNEN